MRKHGVLIALLGLFLPLLPACAHERALPVIIHPRPVFFPWEAASPAVPSDMAVTLMAVGDLMFGRKVESARRGRTDPDPLAAVREVLSSADLTVGNLECVLGTEGDFREWSSYDKIRLGAPADSVRFLTASGFDVVFLGNNHVLDFGKEGLESTARTLSGAGIGAVGWWAGQGVNRPVVLERKGVRFAFLAYSDVSPSYFKAGADSPGTIPPLSEILARDIRAARKIADWVVVSVHWGEEYRRVPTAKQRRIARDMVDRGADLVLGHHPHVIQPFEKYRGRVIAYSLGNFLFDLRNPRSRESLVLRVVFEKGWKPRVAWAPVEIQGTFPVFLEGEPAETAKRCLPWRLPKQAGKAPK